jgi:hypothetical protein
MNFGDNKMIRLKCVNNDCAYSYEVSEKELEHKPQYHQKCFICDSQLEICKASLNDLVKFELFKRAEEHLNNWLQLMGWDNTLDLIKRNSSQSCYKIYKEILQKKGFNIK